MGKILKEMAIIRKYSTEWNLINALLNIPAQTSVTVTYNPPPKKTFVFDYSTTGPMITSNLLTSDVFWDGTRSGIFTAMGSLSDKTLDQGEAPLKLVKNQLTIVIQNLDTVTHTIDIMFWGFLIERGMGSKLVYDISDRGQTDTLMRIESLLREISEKLGR